MARLYALFVTLTIWLSLSTQSALAADIKLLSCNGLVGDLDVNLLIDETDGLIKNMKAPPEGKLAAFRAKYSESALSGFAEALTLGLMYKGMDAEHALEDAEAFLSRPALRDLPSEQKDKLFELYLLTGTSLDTLDNTATDFAKSKLKDDQNSNFYISVMATYQKSSAEILALRDAVLRVEKAALSKAVDSMAAAGEVPTSQKESMLESALENINDKPNEFLNPAILSFLENNISEDALTKVAVEMMLSQEAQKLFMNVTAAFHRGTLIHPRPIPEALSKVAALQRIYGQKVGLRQADSNDRLKNSLYVLVMINGVSPDEVSLILSRLATKVKDPDYISAFLERFIFADLKSKAAMLTILERR